VPSGTAWSRLRPGDHLCWSYGTDRARDDAVAGCVRAGLREGHRVVYFTESLSPDKVIADLAGRGVDVDGTVRSGQLRVRRAAETYLAGGRFEPEAVIAGWAAEADSARADGWSALRAIGDMSWAATRPVPGAGRIDWYEAQVNRVFAGGDSLAMCLYDRRLFDPRTRYRIEWAHPTTAGPDVTPPAGLRMLRTEQPPGIRLEGEADLSNRQALRAVLGHLAADTPGAQQVTVDLSGLRFADLAATRIIVEAAAQAPDRIRVVGASSTLRTLLRFNGGDSV
jgi:anti-anti-sigma factor